MEPEKIFINGKFYTMKKEGDTCEAIAVCGGKIIECGSNEDIRALGGKEIIDLNGKTCIPGMIDSHMHILSYANGLQSVDLRGAKSWEECKRRLMERAKTVSKGEWIRGVCFDHEDWAVPELPDRHQLDEVSTEHPILIGRYCMHVNCANSLALKLGGITKQFADGIPEKSVCVDEQGDPNGILWENAVTPILDILSEGLDTREKKKNVIAAVLKDMNKYGIVGAHTIQGKFCDAKEFIDIYQDLDDEGRLPMRIYISFDEYPTFSMRTGFGNEKIRYGFYKIYSDGSLGSHSACLFEPYSDAPGTSGILNYTLEEIIHKCKTACEMGLQVGIHAIGDKGIDYALQAFESAASVNFERRPRFRLIHGMCMNESLIERMKKLPLIVDIQPGFVSTNVRWSEDRLGPERSNYAYPWRMLIDAGIMLSAGSDVPVENYSPFYGMYAITNRTDLTGYPAGGWHPEQKVTAYEALQMYTINGAYASYEEEIKGSIEAGKLADFVVLDRDILSIDVSEIKDVTVEKTYFAGEEVYSK